MSQGGVIELLVKYNHYETNFLKIEKWLSQVFNTKYLYIYLYCVYLLYLLGVFSLGITKLFETKLVRCLFPAKTVTFKQ